MPGDARREREHHLPCDLHNTSGPVGEIRLNSDFALNNNTQGIKRCRTNSTG